MEASEYIYERDAQPTAQDLAEVVIDPDRRYDCASYQKCLTEAAQRNLKEWNCGACEKYAREGKSVFVAPDFFRIEPPRIETRKEKPVYKKTCAECGKPFESKSPRRLCCSEECRLKRKREREIETRRKNREKKRERKKGGSPLSGKFEEPRAEPPTHTLVKGQQAIDAKIETSLPMIFDTEKCCPFCRRPMNQVEVREAKLGLIEQLASELLSG